MHSWRNTVKYAWHCLCHPYWPQTKWVMIHSISTPAPLAFFRAERSELAGRAQINTLVLSGNTLQSSHNIEAPTHTLHTSQPSSQTPGIPQLSSENMAVGSTEGSAGRGAFTSWTDWIKMSSISSLSQRVVGKLTYQFTKLSVSTMWIEIIVRAHSSV